MFTTIWLQLSKYTARALLNRSSRRKPSRRPSHSRPSLEYLEERIVPDGASGNLGVVTGGNAAVNFQGGMTIIPTTNQSDFSGIAVGVFSSPLNGSGALDVTLLQTLGLAFNANNFNQNALGFGSGTQPNQPWVPNAYNLGLANHQWAYPSMSDHGFPSPGPWYHSSNRLPQDAGDDPLRQDAASATSLAVLDDTQDGKATIAIEDANDSDDDLQVRSIPLLDHAATVAEDVKNDAQESIFTIEADDLDTLLHSTPTSGAEEADLTDVAAVQRVKKDNAWTHSDRANSDDPFVMADGEQIISPLRSLNLSEIVTLSFLTPAQFVALLADFPMIDSRAKVKCLEEPMLV